MVTGADDEWHHRVDAWCREGEEDGAEAAANKALPRLVWGELEEGPVCRERGVRGAV